MREHKAGLRVGLGYRRALHDELMSIDPERLDFVELAPENYVHLGGRWARRLAAIKGRWPILTHGLALSLGGEDPLDSELLSSLSTFTQEIGAPWHSDHLCWSLDGGSHLHELLPMPFTRDSLERVVERVKQVQSALSVPFVIENVSAYGRRSEDTYEESDFLTEIVSRTGCGILLDVNNIYVNAKNFDRDPFAMLARMPAEAAVEIHIAGHMAEDDGLLIDTHGAPIADPVWPLLEEALRRTGPLSILLERDFEIPPLETLMEEIAIIRGVGERVFGSAPPLREVAHG